VVRALGGRVEVVGLSAHRNIGLLSGQIAKHRPRAVAVVDETLADEVRRRTTDQDLAIFSGADALARLASMPEADLVVNALVGTVGLVPTLAAIRSGKDIALANKECLVVAGGMVMSEVRRNKVNLIPVDSEHSAIQQCLRGERPEAVKRIILTASGGPLINVPAGEMAEVRVSETLKHPTWNMGRKVTIDSATLLNKGFEVIEAQWLFGLEADSIEVVVERKSLVHSLVEFVDGVMIGLLSSPDMRLPIQYALTFPERVDTSPSRLSLESIGQIAFEKPDHQRFPCLRLAYEASRLGGTAPAVLSAADEVAVEAFLGGGLAFGDIYPMLSDVLSRHVPVAADDIQLILDADRWAREQAESMVRDISGRA
jgi:1-deoxy-D-xylulose-5-phosphate reductoisomerase